MSHEERISEENTNNSTEEEQFVYWNVYKDVKIKKIVVITFGLTVLYSSSFFMQIISLPYIVKELGIDNVQYGYLQTVFGVVQLIGGPIFGQICDGYGVRKALIISYISTGCCYLFTFLAQGYWTLFLSRVVAVFMHGFQGAQTVIAGVTSGQERTETFGRIGVVFGLGFIIGPSLGGILSKLFGYRAPLLAATMISCFAIFLILKYIPERTARKTGKRADEDSNPRGSSFDVGSFLRIIRYPNVLQLFLVKNLAVTPLIILTSILGLYLVEEYDIGPGMNSFFSVWTGLCIGFMNGFGVVWLRRKFEEPTLLKIGAIDLMFTYLFFALFTQLWQLPFINPFMALGNTLISVIIDSQLTSMVPDNEHGTTLSLSMALNSLIRTGAPMIAGFMLEKLGFASFGILGIVFSAMSLGMVLNVTSKLKQHTEKASKKTD